MVLSANGSLLSCVRTRVGPNCQGFDSLKEDMYITRLQELCVKDPFVYWLDGFMVGSYC